MNVGVIGYGYWGSKHVRVLCSLPGTEVHVIEADPRRRELAQIAFPAVQASDSLESALGDLDALIVATPPRSHAPLAMQAVEAGVHVLIEKPLARTSAEAEELVETAEARGLVLMAGHTFEYNAAVTHLKQTLDSGVLGSVYYLDSSRRNLGLYQSDVNVIWDLAPHDISISNYLIGETPGSVRAWGTDHTGSGQIDVAHLNLHYPEHGVTTYVHLSWLDPSKVRRMTVVGSRKMAVYDDMLADERVRIFDKGLNIEDAGHLHEMPLAYRHGDIVSPFIDFQEPLHVEDSHFLNCVAGREVCRTPGTSGLEVVRVLEAADRALETGEEVAVGGGRLTAGAPR